MMMATTFDVLPAIDLRGGQVVRLEEGDFERETAYSNDPTEVAIEFARLGATWLHVVDLDGARSGAPSQLSAIGSVVDAVRATTSVEVAGGLRDEQTIRAALESGAARAVIGTVAIEEPAVVRRLIDSYAASRIAAAIDVRDGRAIGRGWAATAPGTEATEVIRRLAGAGVTTFEVTSIERDGLLRGPDLALYERVVALGVGSIVASGGVATLADLVAVRGVGCGGAIIGRALYEGRLDLRDALALNRVGDSPPSTSGRS